MSTQAPVVRNDKLLDLAICEGCGFNPAQYWTYGTDRPSAFLCEGCVASAFGTAGIDAIADALERTRSGGRAVSL
jgi:hypothetical protein